LCTEGQDTIGFSLRLLKRGGLSCVEAWPAPEEVFIAKRAAHPWTQPRGVVRPATAPPPSAAPFAIAAIVVAALYFGHELFVPLALAILLSFILAPVVVLLRRWRVGRVLSVVLAVLLAVAIFTTLGAILTRQVTRFAAELPRYEYTIRDKVQRLQATLSRTGVVENASTVLKGVSKELEKPQEENKPKNEPDFAARPDQEAPKPMPVEVHQPPPTAIQSLQNFVGPLLRPLTVAGIVLVFVVFILLQREDLRDRTIRLFGTRDLQRSTAALNDAAYRLSRYFLTQLALNTAFGTVIALGLFAIGVPNAILWGMVAALMRFVPYIGGFIAAGGPALLAIAVDPGWSMALSTLALFVVAEPFMGQVVEPWVYGHSTGVSSLAIIVAATFWTLLWGPVGLLLSTPLTVCLVVLGRHVEQLQFLDVLLGDTPALAPEQTFYQRLLAADPIEIADQADACLETKSLIEYYDDVALKGLSLAQKDVSNGLLDAEACERIVQVMTEVIDDLNEHPGQGESKLTAAAEELKLGWNSGTPVLCMAGVNALDGAAASVLAQMLQKHGIATRTVPWKERGPFPVDAADMRDAHLICLSFLDPSAENAARFLVRRLRRRGAKPEILVVLWGRADTANGHLVRSIGADRVAGSLRQAIAAVHAAATCPADGAERAAE
jgi:predicted PurR-regulated permease PerM/methylmalonyl-CoA mutase cobalamin-binding subunit